MESDGLTNEETEKILQFQDITGIDDINVARDILIRHQWDLEVAFQEQLNIREGRPSIYATESRPVQVVNDRYLQQVFSNTRSPAPPSGITGIFGYFVNYMFNLCYSTISSVITTLLSLFRDRERIVTDPLADVLGFIRTYNDKYPQHPVFYQGTYSQALNDAKRELKFLLVYLHSESNSECVSFCRNTLSNAEVIEYINRNLIFWACDIASPEGFRVSHSINSRITPIMVIVGLRSNKMIIMGRLEGECTAEEMMRRMRSVVGDNEIYLNQARADRFERNLTQSIRLQQDEAYELSLQADREKERKKQEELAAKQRVQESIEAERQAELERKSNIENLKLEMAAKVPSEPSVNSPDAISVVFKLPNGMRLERRFLTSHTLKDIHNYIFCHPDAPDSFEIMTNFPKRVLNCDSATKDETSTAPTLLLAGLKNREVLFVLDLEA